MRTVSRLRLLCFTFNEYLSRVVHLRTYCHVETWSPPSKALLDSHSPEYIISGSANTQMLLVEVGRIELPSATPFG